MIRGEATVLEMIPNEPGLDLALPGLANCAWLKMLKNSERNSMRLSSLTLET